MLKKILCLSLSISFLLAFIITPAQAQVLLGNDLVLPKPGSMVELSLNFKPAILRGIKVNAQNPLKFDFILDPGDSLRKDTSFPNVLIGNPQKEQLRQQTTQLIKYFLTTLTIPDNDIWVNLSPYEKDRIITEKFGQTEMGRNLLAQDYLLKQITASLMFPQGETGKKFWNRIYKEAQKRFGSTAIPVNTFNKVWIMPNKAVIYEKMSENQATAFVIESSLKVMLEEDYLALSHSVIASEHSERSNLLRSKKIASSLNRTPRNDTSALSSKIIREVMIPILQKEVNEGENFAPLRQVYNSILLALWYKQRMQGSILHSAYVNHNKIAGIDVKDKKAAQKIWQQYVQAYKKGVFNFIKEEPLVSSSSIGSTLSFPNANQTLSSPNVLIGDPEHATVARKYFAGGFEIKDMAMTVTHDPAILGSLLRAIGAAAFSAFLVVSAGCVAPTYDLSPGHLPLDASISQVIDAGGSKVMDAGALDDGGSQVEPIVIDVPPGGWTGENGPTFIPYILKIYPSQPMTVTVNLLTGPEWNFNFNDLNNGYQANTAEYYQGPGAGWLELVWMLEFAQQFSLGNTAVINNAITTILSKLPLSVNIPYSNMQTGYFATYIDDDWNQNLAGGRFTVVMTNAQGVFPTDVWLNIGTIDNVANNNEIGGIHPQSVQWRSNLQGMITTLQAGINSANQIPTDAISQVNGLIAIETGWLNSGFFPALMIYYPSGANTLYSEQLFLNSLRNKYSSSVLPLQISLYNFAGQEINDITNTTAGSSVLQNDFFTTHGLASVLLPWLGKTQGSLLGQLSLTKPPSSVVVSGISGVQFVVAGPSGASTSYNVLFLAPNYAGGNWYYEILENISAANDSEVQTALTQFNNDNTQGASQAVVQGDIKNLVTLTHSNPAMLAKKVDAKVKNFHSGDRAMAAKNAKLKLYLAGVFNRGDLDRFADPAMITGKGLMTIALLLMTGCMEPAYSLQPGHLPLDASISQVIDAGGPEVMDAGLLKDAELMVPEAGILDARIPDVGVSDTGALLPDAQLADAGLGDARILIPDAGSSDSGINQTGISFMTTQAVYGDRWTWTFNETPNNVQSLNVVPPGWWRSGNQPITSESITFDPSTGNISYTSTVSGVTQTASLSVTSSQGQLYLAELIWYYQRILENDEEVVGSSQPPLTASDIAALLQSINTDSNFLPMDATFNPLPSADLFASVENFSATGPQGQMDKIVIVPDITTLFNQSQTLGLVVTVTSSTGNVTYSFTGYGPVEIMSADGQETTYPINSPEGQAAVAASITAVQAAEAQIPQGSPGYLQSELQYGLQELESFQQLANTDGGSPANGDASVSDATINDVGGGDGAMVVKKDDDKNGIRMTRRKALMGGGLALAAVGLGGKVWWDSREKPFEKKVIWDGIQGHQKVILYGVEHAPRNIADSLRAFLLNFSKIDAILSDPSRRKELQGDIDGLKNLISRERKRIDNLRLAVEDIKKELNRHPEISAFGMEGIVFEGKKYTEPQQFKNIATIKASLRRLLGDSFPSLDKFIDDVLLYVYQPQDYLANKYEEIAKMPYIGVEDLQPLQENILQEKQLNYYIPLLIRLLATGKLSEDDAEFLKDWRKFNHLSPTDKDRIEDIKRRVGNPQWIDQYVQSFIKYIELVNKRSFIMASNLHKYGKDVILVVGIGHFDLMKDALSKANHAMLSNTGGIDLTKNATPLDVRHSGDAVRFHIDPAQIAQVNAAPGFMPQVFSIKRLQSLPEFLGLTQQEAQLLFH